MGANKPIEYIESTLLAATRLVDAAEPREKAYVGMTSY
jgi:hypothetical protein